MSLDMLQQLNELPTEQQVVVLLELVLDVQKAVQQGEKNTAEAIARVEKNMGEALGRLDAKITPIVDLYTKVQTLGWAGKIVVGLVLGLMALAVGTANFWRVFGPPKP